LILIDIAFQNEEDPAKGKLLISDPFLDEDYFRRSVVYLCEHNDDGSFGFVVNNFISINLNELDESLPKVETHISLGGPMEVNSLYFIHQFGDQIENSAEISPGVFLGGDFQQLSNKIVEDESNISKVRFIIGYAGWKRKQLQEEIENNAWIVKELSSPFQLFESKSRLSWKRMMFDLGGKYKIMSKFPLTPMNN
jgi:putative transcriptional regulator